MAQSKFTLYKCVKFGDGSWRYKKAAFYSNGKIKPNVVVAGKKAQGKPIEEVHAEGSYKMNHNGSFVSTRCCADWICHARAGWKHDRGWLLKGLTPHECHIHIRVCAASDTGKTEGTGISLYDSTCSLRTS